MRHAPQPARIAYENGSIGAQLLVHVQTTVVSLVSVLKARTQVNIAQRNAATTLKYCGSALALLLGSSHVSADEPSLASYVGEATEALPQVYLEEHVPERWLSGAADRMPLQPKRWRTRMPRRCRTQGGYRNHCQGRRIVAEPQGPSLALADRLALGHRAVALHLRLNPAIAPWLKAAKNTDGNPRLTFPVPDGRRGRGFGRVRKGSLKHRKHLGIDIGADRGADIVAARGGLVVFSDNTVTGYGNAVMILHEDDSTTFYAHCERTVVAPGDYVRRGQKIAEIGKTGFAGAPHLHFEWRTRGWARNPAPYFIWPEHEKKKRKSAARAR